MKTISLALSLLCISAAGYSQTALSGTTLGFGAGYQYVFGDVSEYSLSTDGKYNLQIDRTPHAGFAISSVVTVRLGEVAKLAGTNKLLSQSKAAAALAPITPALAGGFQADPHERWCINLAINIAEVKADGVAFNKLVDGGLGLGYFVNDNIQVSFFLDVQRIRQLRESVADRYKGLPIAKGNDVYTALDISDNDLFTTKTFAGVSVKLIYSLPNSE